MSLLLDHLNILFFAFHISIYPSFVHIYNKSHAYNMCPNKYLRTPWFKLCPLPLIYFKTFIERMLITFPVPQMWRGGWICIIMFTYKSDFVSLIHQCLPSELKIWLRSVKLHLYIQTFFLEGLSLWLYNPSGIL